ncbi:hypothetical protein [Glycomyces tarimensis]
MARGISTATIARRTAALAIAAAAATGLSACGAGQVTQTDTKQTAVDGANVAVGDLSLRDLEVAYASPDGYEAGDDAPLGVWISNEGTETVSLVGVESEVAEAVTLVGAGEGIDAPETPEVPEGDGDENAPGDDEATPEGDSSETPTGDATDEPTGDATETPTGESTESPADEPTGETTESPDEEATAGSTDIAIEIGPADYVRLDQATGQYLLLEGLTEAVPNGVDVPVTFLFSNGEEITVELPVGQPLEPADREYYEHPGADH